MISAHCFWGGGGWHLLYQPAAPPRGGTVVSVGVDIEMKEYSFHWPSSACHQPPLQWRQGRDDSGVIGTQIVPTKHTSSYKPHGSSLPGPRVQPGLKTQIVERWADAAGPWFCRSHSLGWRPSCSGVSPGGPQPESDSQVLPTEAKV